MDWLSPPGVDKGLRCAIPAVTKEELAQREHATKLNELLGMYSPKELTSAYIVVCMANGIGYKQVDMVSEFSLKARAIKIFTAACVFDRIINVETSDEESDIGSGESKLAEG